MSAALLFGCDQIFFPIAIEYNMTLHKNSRALAAMRMSQGFGAGAVIGTVGGLIGLGGAEFRLPVLIGLFRFDTLEAIVFNKAMSVVVVVAALFARLDTIPLAQMGEHVGVVVNLLAGSLGGAWWAAGHAVSMPRRWLDRIVVVLLVGLALLLLAESWLDVSAGAAFTLTAGLRFMVGLVAGFGIGMVAALLGVAGGELLIPTLVLLYGLDIKLAGSLSLAVSLPTMVVGFVRYTQAQAIAVLGRERLLFGAMAAGSIVGAGLGGLLLGTVPAQALTTALGVILLISAVKIVQQRH